VGENYGRAGIFVPFNIKVIVNAPNYRVPEITNY